MRFISLTSFNRHLLVTEVQCVYCEVRVKVLNKMEINFMLQRVDFSNRAWSVMLYCSCQ